MKKLTNSYQLLLRLTKQYEIMIGVSDNEFSPLYTQFSNLFRYEKVQVPWMYSKPTEEPLPVFCMVLNYPDGEKILGTFYRPTDGYWKERTMKHILKQKKGRRK